MDAHIESLLAELCELSRLNSIPFRQRPAAQASAIAKFRSLYGKSVDGLARVFAFANGLEACGLTICALEEVFEYGDDLLAFQNWGNGDYDCVTIRGEPHEIGTVMFANHQPTHRATVAPSIRAWLELVITEAKSRGEVLHPRDYVDRVDSGAYSPVLIAFAGVECELGRWLRDRRCR